MEVRLARIEVKLDAHFSRDDERAVKWEGHEKRIKALESAEDRRKGGKAMLVALMGAAAALGGIVAKMLPFGAR